ncbi:MAG: hypothetical protein QM742_07710 [Aquabacterium sp.]
MRVRVLYKGAPLPNTKVSFIPNGITLKGDTDHRKDDGCEGETELTFKEATSYLITTHKEDSDAKGPGFQSIGYSPTYGMIVAKTRNSWLKPWNHHREGPRRQGPGSITCCSIVSVTPGLTGDMMGTETIGLGGKAILQPSMKVMSRENFEEELAQHRAPWKSSPVFRAPSWLKELQASFNSSPTADGSYAGPPWSVCGRADANGGHMLYNSGVPREEFSKFQMPNTEVFAPTFAGEATVRPTSPRTRATGENSPNQGMPPGHLPVRSYLAVPVI